MLNFELLLHYYINLHKFIRHNDNSEFTIPKYIFHKYEKQKIKESFCKYIHSKDLLMMKFEYL